MNQQYEQLPTEGRSFDDKYGNMVPLCHSSSSPPLLIMGPHWYIFMGALLVISSLLIFMLITTRNQFKPLLLIIISISILIFIISYLMVGCTDPGIVTTSLNRQNYKRQEIVYCSFCKIYVKSNVRHCRECDVCIQDLDHHCPWVGKCVGRNNLCAFYLFLGMTFGTLMLFFVGAASTAAMD